MKLNLGIDASTTNTGWALLPPANLDDLKLGIFSPPHPAHRKHEERLSRAEKSALITSRISFIVAELRKLLDNNQIGCAYIEDYTFHTENSREVMGEVSGCVKLLLLERGIPCVPVGVSTVRAYILPKIPKAKKKKEELASKIPKKKLPSWWVKEEIRQALNLRWGFSLDEVGKKYDGIEAVALLVTALRIPALDFDGKQAHRNDSEQLSLLE